MGEYYFNHKGEYFAVEYSVWIVNLILGILMISTNLLFFTYSFVISIAMKRKETF